MTPAELSDDVLRTLRREFFARKTDRDFYQQRDRLREAIAFPARWLNERGARLPASKYRAILSTVIQTIKNRGNVAKIDRFSVYFLHCVQAHMNHHGDEYRQAAKDAEARPVGSLVNGVLRRATGGADLTVDVLAEAHRALSSRRRIQKVKKTAVELDLFDECTPCASDRKRPRK